MENVHEFVDVATRDEDKLRHIFQILKVQEIQEVFDTVQVQISNFKLCDHENYFPLEKVDWADGSWRKYHCGKNNYSFDALQAYCCGINFKL